MKKVIVLLLISAVMLFTGCSKKDASENNAANSTPLKTEEKVIIEIEFPYAELFSHVHEEIMEKFHAQNPGIEVVIRSTYDSYEDATQKVLRASMTNTLPDITFQGLNRFRVFVDKEIAIPLDSFIEKEENFSADGFNDSMFAAGDFNGSVYGLPFAVSLPIAYYNMDLVRAAGWDENNLPETWDEVIQLANKIDALEDEVHGMFFSWQITGNWFWQALVFSQGGSMLNTDESKVAFDGPQGEWAIDTFNRMITEGHQPDRASNDAQAEFASGMIGIYFTSTAILYNLTEMIGDKFELRTHNFPSVADGGSLPAGGNGALIVTQDPVKQAAAWEVLKFWCGVEGAEVVARKTGYMPPNRIAAETTLKQFYIENPNNMAAVNQLPLMTKWYAFPGENSLKITDGIYGKMELIATGKASNPRDVLREMSVEVQALLPE